MPWLFLMLAIGSEIFATSCLKLSNGFSRSDYALATLIGYPTAFFFFGLSLKEIDVSIAYAIWSGIGVVGTSILGAVVFQESMNPSKVCFIGLTLIGILGLNLSQR
jgi:multidrug transporter EmrE-like cation transporter